MVSQGKKANGSTIQGDKEGGRIDRTAKRARETSGNRKVHKIREEKTRDPVMSESRRRALYTQ